MTNEVLTFLSEDILGEFGFRVEWHYASHYANVKAFNIEARGMDASRTPMFPRKDSYTSPDHVLETENAEPYLEGTLKWDGCSDINQGDHHGCDEQFFIKHSLLLRYLWTRAHQLMPASEHNARSKN